MKLWFLSALYTLAGVTVVGGLIYLLTLAPHWFVMGVVITLLVGFVSFLLLIPTWAAQELLADQTGWHPAWCWVLASLITLGGAIVLVGAFWIGFQLPSWVWYSFFGISVLAIITGMVREELVRRSQ